MLLPGEEKGDVYHSQPRPAPDAIIPWFPYVEVIVPNETEYEHYTKMREISVGKNIFFDAGIRWIAVTLGKKGIAVSRRRKSSARIASRTRG